MGFSVKAALLVSVLFIGGMAWLIHNVGAPVAALPSPLATGGPTGGAKIPLAPTGVVRGLEHRSPIERQEAENRADHESLVLRDERGAPGALPPLELPPVEGESDPTSSGVAAAVGVVNGVGSRTGEAAPHTDELLTPRAAQANVPSNLPPAVVERTSPVMPTEDSQPVLPPPAPPEPKRYVVQRGDSVLKIVRTQWNSEDPRLIDALVAANPKIRSRQNRILIGEELVIPVLDRPQVVVTDAPRTPTDTDGRAGARPPESDVPRATPRSTPRPRRDVPADPRRDKPQPPAVVRAEESAAPAQRPSEPRPGLRPVPSEPDAMRIAKDEPKSRGLARVSSERSAPPDKQVVTRDVPSRSDRKPAPRPEPAHGVKRVTGPLAKKLTPAQTGAARWYTIQRNDSLRTIARRFLKDERRWPEIAALNPSLRDADRLTPGTKIKLPERIASR